MNATRAGLVAAALAGLVAPLHAQIPLTPRALGMGNAYVAVARGQESLFQNPANLGLANSPHWSIAFPQISVGATALGLDVDDLRDLTDYDDLEQSRKDEILAGIPTSGTGLEYDLRIPLAAVQAGRVAFGLSYGTFGDHSLDRDIVDLFLNGYDTGDTSLDLSGTVGKRATYVDFAAGYGRRVGPVSVGATAHYYMGRHLSRSGIVSVEYILPPLSPDVEVTYAGVLAEGGSGFGVDLGIAAEPAPGLTLSASVSNAFSSMSWDDDVRGRKLVLNRADFDNSEYTQITNEYEESETDAAALVADADIPAAGRARIQGFLDTLEEDAEFPATLRAGAAWSPIRGTDLAVGVQKELTDGGLSGAWDDQLSLGVQQKIPVVTLRAGFASNLDDGSILSGGLSLGPLQMGLARWSNGSVEDADRKGWIFTFGISGRSNSTQP
jgi:hypothetical protein